MNYGANVVTIYKKDENNEYTVPFKAMVCSTGTATPTSGKYSIKGKWRWLGLQGGVYGQYSTQIVGNILFHSVPYLEKGNLSSLEYWEYDKLGTSCSAGCIRLTVRDAKWIYDNIPKGTIVEFYSDSNPGPLGKPSAQKISGNEANRGWDPTDPAEGNPWRNTSNNKPKPPAENNENNTNDNEGNTIVDNPGSGEGNTTVDNPDDTEGDTTTDNTNNNQENTTQDNTTVDNTVKNNKEENIVDSTIVDNTEI